jgi:hypothetical protein
MTATALGENPRSLLGATPEPDTSADPEPWRPTGTVTGHRFGLQWNNATQRCDCRNCWENRHPPVPVTVSEIAQLTAKGPWGKFADVLDALRPFKTYGKLKGVLSPLATEPGYLRSRNEAAANLWRADFDKIDYVVYSYNTPIAWHVTTDTFSEWIFPEVKYSRTTSAHQTKIRTALNYSANALGTNVRFLREA